MPLVALHHVQLVMPEGGEAAARDFYLGLLGLPEIAKPAALAARGGCWFEAGAVRLHLGVERDFRPARKAHPALTVAGYDAFLAHLDRHGVAATKDEAIPGTRRAYIADPFGNRIELIAAD